MTAPVASAVLAALVLAPAGVGALLLVLGRRAERVAGPAAGTIALTAVALAGTAAATRPEASASFLGIPGGELAVAVDGLSAVLVVTVSLVAAAVTVFAVADLPGDAARARFFGYLLLFTAAMLATVTATTVPTLLVAWEIMGATSYALIGFLWQVPGKMSAGTTAFITTRAGDLGLYIAAGAALAGTGTLVLDDLASAEGAWRHVAAAGILVAALGKSAQLPFSAWLSAAMEGPSPVSALLHSATMVAAGGYLLLRTEPLLDASGWAGPAAAWVGALTALVLGAVAAAQRDLKQLLAASTGAQIGFVVLAAGVGVTAAGTFQLVAHAAVKAGLFVAAGAWLTALGTKQLAGLRGAARRYPVIGAAATLAALALAGVPPLALWASKDEVLAGVDGGVLRAVALTAGALSAVYAGKILAVVLSPVDADTDLDSEERGTRRVPRPVTGVVLAFAAAAALLGAVALPGAADAMKSVLGAEGQPSPAPGELVLSGVIAVAVVVLVVRRPGLVAALERTELLRWAGLRQVLTPRPWLALARAAARVDDRVIDRAVVSVAAAARRGAGRIGRADDHVIDRSVLSLARAVGRGAGRVGRSDVDLVDGAVLAFASAMLRAGAAMRRPQTGLLHQYYVQAVVGLGALFALLIVVR